ncbi:MAG: hypothetical protein ACOZNI_30840 [Myxococcota bacterium]
MLLCLLSCDTSHPSDAVASGAADVAGVVLADASPALIRARVDVAGEFVADGEPVDVARTELALALAGEWTSLEGGTLRVLGVDPGWAECAVPDDAEDIGRAASIPGPSDEWTWPEGVDRVAATVGEDLGMLLVVDGGTTFAGDGTLAADVRSAFADDAVDASGVTVTVVAEVAELGCAE